MHANTQLKLLLSRKFSITQLSKLKKKKKKKKSNLVDLKEKKNNKKKNNGERELRKIEYLQIEAIGQNKYWISFSVVFLMSLKTEKTRERN